jgi:hypothetical protein
MLNHLVCERPFICQTGVTSLSASFYWLGKIVPVLLRVEIVHLLPYLTVIPTSREALSTHTPFLASNCRNIYLSPSQLQLSCDVFLIEENIFF